MLVKVNLSKKEDYHTQRNNKLEAATACVFTSLVNASKASGIFFHYPTGYQPEDYLTEKSDSPHYWSLAKEISPKLVAQGYPPRQIYSVVEEIFNDVVGYEATKFIDGSSIQTMVYRLWVEKTACVVDGKFTRNGHAVAVVGFTYEHNWRENWKPRIYSDIVLSKIKTIIVDDSWGDYHSGYDSVRGNDVEFSLDEFNNLTNQYGIAYNKRMFVFYRR